MTHVAENGEGLREETERGVGSDEGIEEVGRAASGEGEDGDSLWELGAGGVGGGELGSNEIVSVDLLEGVEVVFGRACFQESSVERDYVWWFGHKIGEDEAAIDELDSFL
ncbi:unnamed protein product, partial [Citrullus colocynthis]